MTPESGGDFNSILGSTITDAEGVSLTFAPDGTYTGSSPDGNSFAGTWAIKNGQLCESLNGRENDETCYLYNVDDGRVTLTEPGEPGRVFLTS
ncbi:MAG: hypothetical protein AAGF71_05240 [Pseudomonadota bacterium]